MLLAIDVGNTLTDFGLFADDKLLSSYVMDSDTKRSEDETRSRLLLMFSSLNIELSEIDEVIISSVVPSIGTILTSLSQKLFNVKAKVIGPGLKNGLQMRVDNPSEVGADLIADAVGGKERYGNSLFIADLGTASKYLYIDEDGAYSGLAIAPGMRLSLDALVNGTAALPEISLTKKAKIYGKNTVDCMVSGIINGTVYQVRGFAEAYEKAVGHKLTKILTGGNAEYVKDELPDFIYDKDLLMEGLLAINLKNRK